MNQICPNDGKLCMLGCKPLCAPQPRVNALATALPEKSDESFASIFPPFVAAMAERVGVELDIPEETAKITLKLPL